MHLKKNHFVVISETNKKKVSVSDPASGNYKWTWEELEKEWSGYIIVFSVNDDFKKGNYKENRYEIFRAIIKKNNKCLLWCFVLSTIIIGITLGSAYVFQLLIDYGGVLGEIAEHNPNNKFLQLLIHITNMDIGRLLLVLVFSFAIMSVFFYIRGTIISKMSKKIDLALIDDYVTKILQAKIRDIASRMTGEYLSRISDIVSVRNMISSVVVSFFLDILMIGLSTIILIDINMVLFTIVLAMLILYAVVIRILNTAFRRTNYEIMDNNAVMQSFFNEVLQGSEVIKTNNITHIIKRTFMEKYLEYANSLYKGNQLSVFSGSLSLLIEQVCNVVVIFAGFYLVRCQVISLGDLLSFYMIVSCLLTPVKDILSIQSTYQAAVISLDRIQDIQYMEDERIYEGKNIVKSNIEFVEFNNVCYHYPGKGKLLENISFRVEKRMKIAVVGDNGAGKSTLMKLLLGVDNVLSGQILINGIDIEKIDLKEIRDNVAYVVQNNFLFADSIRNNITLYDKNISEENIKFCSKITGLDSFVDAMPMGYETYVSENGSNLSFGQRQAIAITRALIRKPQLLILDEATSNMDYEREKK